MLKNLLMVLCLLAASSSAQHGVRVGQLFLDEDVLVAADLSDGYQQEALQDANANLPADATDVQLRNYYALACLYRASFGQPNPRTMEIIPGATIPEWKDATNWIENANYCVWFGITCDGSGNVSEIDLSLNSLYGVWPNEIVLLQNSLTKIEIFGNSFLYSDDPKFLLKMNVLEFLYFGSTAFTFDGIPEYLNGCTSLIELDMSKTFWNGKIRGEAFSNLINLEYLDMGDNTFDTTGVTSIPSELTGLSSIENFYLDRCEFSPNQINLDFLGSFTDTLLECWMDFTKFDTTIPTQIESLTNLASFSCSYCGLTGSIPSELGSTNMDRLWLFGNDLVGTIPEALKSLTNMRFLFLEDNDLVGAVPNNVCTDLVDLEEFGVDCDVGCSCCSCCGETCGNLEEATPAPTPAPTMAPDGPRFCFSGQSLVDVEHYGLQKLSNLALGDRVKVNAGDVYEPIYSFGHKNAQETAEFLSIEAAGAYKIELSSNHMVATIAAAGERRFVPASHIQRGDQLVTGSGNVVSVERIRTVTRKGVYAPFTASGTIVVNDIVASNYVAFQDKAGYSMFGGMVEIDYHWLAHAFNSVHRMAYHQLGGAVSDESYTENGTSHWVAGPHVMALWMLEQHGLIQMVLVTIFVGIFGTASLVEQTSRRAPLAVLVVAVVGIVVASRRQMKKQKQA